MMLDGSQWNIHPMDGVADVKSWDVIVLCLDIFCRASWVDAGSQTCNMNLLTGAYVCKLTCQA